MQCREDGRPTGWILGLEHGIIIGTVFPLKLKNPVWHIGAMFLLLLLLLLSSPAALWNEARRAKLKIMRNIPRPLFLKGAGDGSKFTLLQSLKNLLFLKAGFRLLTAVACFLFLTSRHADKNCPMPEYENIYVPRLNGKRDFNSSSIEMCMAWPWLWISQRKSLGDIRISLVACLNLINGFLESLLLDESWHVRD